MITSLANPPIVLASAMSLDEVRALADAGGQAAEFLPVLVLAGVAAAGLALWAIGGRFVRPSVVLVASAAGGYVGFTLGEGLDPAMGPWIGMALGISAGVLLGCWLFRMAAGVLLAAFLAVAAPTAAAVALDYDLAARAGILTETLRDAASGAPDGDDDAGAVRIEVVSPDSLDARETSSTIEDGPREARGEIAERAASWLRAFARDVADGGEAIWNETDADERRTLVAAAVLGAVAGMLIGVVAPVVGMAVLTSGLGAAAALGAGSRLALGLNPELAGSLPSSPIAWAAIWVSVSLLGVVIQVAPHRKRRARRSAPDFSTSPD